MKLVWRHYETDDISYGIYYTIPFEYITKDDFILYVLELIEKRKSISNITPYINLLGMDDCNCEKLEKEILEEVYTLDEWFREFKTDII